MGQYPLADGGAISESGSEGNPEAPGSSCCPSVTAQEIQSSGFLLGFYDQLDSQNGLFYICPRSSGVCDEVLEICP